MGPDCGVVSGEGSALTGVVALPPGRRSGVLGRPGGNSGVAGNRSTSRSGGTDVRRFTSHLTDTQFSWMRGKPTTFAETASSMEL